MKNKNRKKHLPLFGVGPVIVLGQILFTGITIVLSYILEWNYLQFDILDIPLKVIGIILIVLGFYMDYCAKNKSKLFENVADNKLIVDGIYGIVRNPVYSGAFIACIGAVCLTNKLALFAVSVVCWIYMTLFLIDTEEKWLKELYGQEYIDYCERVNRCIPWFPGK